MHFVKRLLLTLVFASTGLGICAQESQEADESIESVSQEIDYFLRDTYRIDTLICPFRQELDYEPGEIECGLLEVPENREDPDSRFIELHFVKINARTDQDIDSEKEQADTAIPKPETGKREDPVIYLTGGPGAKVITYVKRFKDHGLIKHRDLYILEQRGIGWSDDFCGFYSQRKPQAANVTNFKDNLQAGIEDANDCALNATRSGVDLRGYNTIENARDVKALRRALGFEQWNVWGISYGSILGQAYIKTDPEGIRAVVLDAIMPLFARDDALYWRVAKWYDRDLKKLDEACQAHAECASEYPELGKRLRQAVKTVVDNPIVVDVKDIETYPDGKAYIFQDIAAFLPFIMLYEQSNYPSLPAIIYAWSEIVERRDPTFFQALTTLNANFFTSSRGMSDAILCQDGGMDSQMASGIADIEEFPVLGAAIGSKDNYQKIAARCAESGTPARPASEYAMTETDIPSMIVEGDMDPITPPPLAKAIMPGFSNGTYVEFAYAGHGPTRSVECAGDMLNLFYDSPDKKPDLSCAESMQLPEFIAPLFVTSAAPRLAALMAEDKKAIVGPAVWGGMSSLVCILGLIILSLSQIGRWIDKKPTPQTMGARMTLWSSCLLSTAGILILAGSVAATIESNPFLILFGLVPSAKWGSWLILLAGLSGLYGLFNTLRLRKSGPLAIGTLTGFIVTSMASISLLAFVIYWDLAPF